MNNNTTTDNWTQIYSDYKKELLGIITEINKAESNSTNGNNPDRKNVGNRFDAMTTNFEEVTILNNPALFTCGRIDHSTVPKGYHIYEVRHDDECRGNAAQLAKKIIVNHWGTLITRDEITDVTKDGYKYIEPEALNYGAGDCRTMTEFMEKYPCFRLMKSNGAAKYTEYTITDFIKVGNKRFVFGVNFDKENPYVTLSCSDVFQKDDKGSYFSSCNEAVSDLQKCAYKEFKNTCMNKTNDVKQRDDAR